MKSYMQTRKAIKILVLEIGLNNINGYHQVKLMEEGHGAGNIQDAMNYFRYSSKTAKYR